MLEMYDFSVVQVRYVKAATDEIPEFQPDYKSPADVAAMLPTPDTVRGNYVTKKTLAGAARDARNFGAKAVHEACVDFLAQARSVYRKNPAVQEQLDRIIIKDETCQQCLTRGDQTSALWSTLPEVGTPPAAFTIRRSEGNVSQLDLDNLIEEARAADVALPSADQNFQRAEADLHVKHHGLDDFVTAALAQGRSQFGEGTAEREIIAAIPTAPAQNPPGQAVISSATLVDGTHAKLVFDAPGGTSFDVLYQSPAEEGYNLIAEDIIEREFIAPVVTGDNTFKVVPRNSRGAGPESAVATVTA